MPSKLEGYSLVFETDFRNPDKALDVFDGGIYVKGDFSNNGVLTIRDKPDRFSLVVLGNAFQRNRAHITGKVHVTGNLKLVGEEDLSEVEDQESDDGSSGGGSGKPDCPVTGSQTVPGAPGTAAEGAGNSCNSSAGGGGKPSDPGSQGKGKPEDPGSQGKGQDKPKKQSTYAGSRAFVSMEGAAFVGRGFESHVSTVVNNLNSAQKIADFLLEEVFPASLGGEVEWVATTPLEDVTEGEPGVSVYVYRPLAEISLSPPRSLVVPREVEDIDLVRHLYRLAEQGETEPALEELAEERFINIVVGNSPDYFTLLEASSLPRFLVGMRDVVRKLRAAGAQEIAVSRSFFVPPAFYFSRLVVDGKTLDAVKLYPMSPSIFSLDTAGLGEVAQQLEELRSDPELLALRNDEWARLFDEALLSVSVRRSTRSWAEQTGAEIAGAEGFGRG